MEFSGGTPAELHPGGAAIVQFQVDPYFEPEMGDAFNDSGLATERVIRMQYQIVRADPFTVEFSCRPEELHDELVGRVVVHFGRIANLLEAPLVNDG